MKKSLLGFFVVFLILGCASAKKKISKSTNLVFSSALFKNQFTGFIVFDPVSRDTLYDLNGSKYFTPASNTKIFTLYASLQLLPDQIPALKYMESNDTLYVEGTGDPSFLHPYLKDSTALDFLKENDNIVLDLNNYQNDKLGPGWSWADYHYYYQPERSAFPLYGNVTTIHSDTDLFVSPDYFKKDVIPIDFKVNRALEKNIFYFSPSRKDTLEVPYKTDSTLTKKLLESVLNKKIRLAQKMPLGEKKVVYGLPSDSLYRRMMHESDNFIAEQLLVVASSTLSDTLDGEKVQQHILDTALKDLEDPPRWVDGSGLSRYNLFTPRSIVFVLDQLYQQLPRARLLGLFPAGGVSGTLENWYPGNSEPYIYAKTGSLSNNHCLSGYLLTKSGKTLIFSFMNNHFRRPSAEVKQQMQQVLEKIRDTY